MRPALVNKKTALDDLAIFGGLPVRVAPMPARMAFGLEEMAAVRKVFEHANREMVDFGYQGEFERAYTDAFVRYMGGEGYADGICSGTAALFVALAALQLPAGSHVLVSPVTDPGTLNAIIMNQLVPVLVDAMPGSYNMGPEQIKARLTSQCRAVMLVHCGGKAAPCDEIADLARQHDLALVEDCSQAHGAKWKERTVGTFGDVAVFSTMYSKAHATGGCGGVVYTRDLSLYRFIRAIADRGKPFWEKGYDGRNPHQCLFPALNLNLDEISSAIGLASLSKLNTVIERRIHFLKHLQTALSGRSQTCRALQVTSEDSPFFWPVEVNVDQLNCTKIEFARAVEAEGISLNPHYPLVVSDWPYVQPYLYDTFRCEQAEEYRNRSFNLLFNENFGTEEAEDIVESIVKVEKAYTR